MTLSSCGEAHESRSDNRGGAVSRWALTVAGIPSTVLKGCSPARSRNRVHPSEYTSARPSSGSPVMTSGATYAIVAVMGLPAAGSVLCTGQCRAEVTEHHAFVPAWLFRGESLTA